MENKEELKPIDNNVVITTTLVFYEEPTEPDTLGSNNIVYEVTYCSKSGFALVDRVGAFGDRTQIGVFKNKNNSKITLNEMLENIQEFSNMTLKEFKKLLRLGGK